MEFKYGKSAQEAIDQIKTQQYYKRYTEQYRNIILVGITIVKPQRNMSVLLKTFNEIIG
jgi:hypothetical protein